MGVRQLQGEAQSADSRSLHPARAGEASPSRWALAVPRKRHRSSVPGAFPPRRLKSPSPHVRSAAASLLARIGPEAAPATPELLALLADPFVPEAPRPPRFDRGPDPARSAAWALSKLPPTREIVSGLVSNLTSPLADQRSNAAQFLGDIGPGARAAVPALIDLLRHQLADDAVGWEIPTARRDDRSGYRIRQSIRCRADGGPPLEIARGASPGCNGPRSVRGGSRLGVALAQGACGESRPSPGKCSPGIAGHRASSGQSNHRAPVIIPGGGRNEGAHRRWRRCPSTHRAPSLFRRRLSGPQGHVLWGFRGRRAGPA